MSSNLRYCICYFLISACYSVLAQSEKSILDIRYAITPERELKLDLFLPDAPIHPYLILWIHGGAWHSGSKNNPPKELLKKGYALASIEYRLSVEAKFPAQIHDIKAAIRFLRANALKFGFRADKIIIWGASAGGHLAALTGLTNDNVFFEGKIGEQVAVSSRVQGVIDFYGPSDFTTILDQSTPHGLEVRTPALALLFGKPIDQCKKEMEVASPVFHVTDDDPPLFICHGDRDVQVPINQSIELYGKYKEQNLPVQFEFVFGAAHGGLAFGTESLIHKVDVFLKSILNQK